MGLHLKDYADAIYLTTPFIAEPLLPNALEAVLSALEDDPVSQNFLRRYPQPFEPQAQRRWVQAALTIRPPAPISTALLAATDSLLQEDLNAKQITKAEDLPRLGGAYPAAPYCSLWDGDIATLAADAITNAANAQMLGCFQPFHACIDNVIQCAAGPRMREDCHTVIQLQGHDEPTGTAKITRAYHLPSRFVLHTVGPIVMGGQSPSALQRAQLADCYKNCLSLAAEVGARTIALCGISTGVFGYPMDQAAQVALQSVSEWLFDLPKDQRPHVVFNTYGTSATQIYNHALENWR